MDHEGRPEHELLEQIAELEQVLSSVSDYVWSAEVTDSGMEYRYYSPVVEKLTGRAPSFYLAGGWVSTVHPDDRDQMANAGRRLVMGESELEEEEYRILRPDGSVRWLRDRVVADRRPDGSIRLNGVVSDVTERRRADKERQLLEAQLQRTQRMQSLGLLAGGVAHDFNNLLVGVLGNVDLALMKLAPDASARAELMQVQSTALVLADLCRQLLAYSGKGKFVVESLQLAELVEDMARLLDISRHEGHTLTYEFGEGLSPIAGDATQIRQAVMNLLSNATEAIGARSGAISIRVGQLQLGAKELARVRGAEPLAPGVYVSLEISDTGCGMDEEVREHIFDPFYSSKSNARGLGLPAVLGIVRSHNGGLRIRSESGQGSTVELLFPATERPALVHEPAAEPAPKQGGGCVLVVDDEARVQAVTRRILEAHGFSTLVASSGAEALEQVHATPQGLVAVLLDMRMPGMDGRQTFARLHELMPSVPVILMSGQHENDSAKHFADEGFAAFLPKPFRLAELMRTLNSVLN